MEIVSKNLEETRQAAGEFLKKLEEEPETEGATVAALFGELGSGKTAFTKLFGEILGVKETIQSPTFVIEKFYKIDHPRWKTLVHIDTYRLETEDELIKIGWEKVLADKDNLIFIEWPERVKKIMPEKYVPINFEFVNTSTELGTGELTRKITF